MVEVTLENDYYGKLNIAIVKGSIGVISNFQFTIVKFILVNFHDYGRENKDDPSPITKKNIGGYISSSSQLCLFR